MAGTQTGPPPVYNSLPSDFSDVQPKTYDPQFISQISNKMQVPEKIKAVDGMADRDSYPVPSQMAAVSMQVPDRIMLDEQRNERNRLERLDFTHTNGSMQYVGLMTPPRTLTMEEAFSEHVPTEEMINDMDKEIINTMPNGDTYTQFTPGASLSDSILHNEEDPVRQLQIQCAKMSRRIAVIEEENKGRSRREWVLSSVVMLYFLSKVFTWFAKSKH